MMRLDFNKNWTVLSENNEIRAVNLPDDAMIYEKRDKNCIARGANGYFPPGKYTYIKEWYVPAEYKDKQVILECEGVYQNSHVLLNDEEIYFRPYGYTNYFVDFTDKLNYGQNNKITIIADNSKAPNTRWYSGSGIYREVALYIGEKFSIAPEGIKIHTVSKNRVSVKVELNNTPNNSSSDLRINVQIFDGDKIIAESEGIDCEVTIPNAVCWNENTPKLYECKVDILLNGVVVDSDTEKFGIRTIEWNSKGLFLNNKEVLLRGACIHHDNGVLGACGFADAEYRRVKIIKEAGFNAIRSSHNPISKAMLKACDELGIYVMDETFDMWFIHKNPYDYGGDTFTNWWKTDVRQMVNKDYCHPSVIMYSIGNEISDFGNIKGQQMCKIMSDYIRTIDSTRAVTSGCNLMLATLTAKGKGLYGDDKNTGSQSMDSAPTSEFFNILMNKLGTIMEFTTKGKAASKIVAKTSCYLDIPGYNYAGMRYNLEAKQYPGRPFVGSETLPQRLFYNWQKVKSIPELTGDFMWAGWDYLGEAGIGTVKYMNKTTKQPAESGLTISSGAGVIDITGYIRPEVQWNKIIWGLSSKPAIAVEPMNMSGYQKIISMWRNTDSLASWSWGDCEGLSSTVIVYANGYKAQLIVNKNIVATKKIKEHKAVFKKVIYLPGEIETRILNKSGNIIAKKKLISATGRTSITISADKTQLRSNGQDLCFIDINLIGENGIVKVNNDRKITISIDGPACIQGFGSARPCMSENFYSNTHTTYRGHALAVIRAGYETGTVNVLIKGEDLEEKRFTISVV